ncbi:hypothetical protein Dvina_12780 [Dactylosporangium vinaceum]|uniref:DUF6285 domain-containing protein n=1 Tax=Dactylosporangium vinaceum TaxID=53362 RepID=A0ABV5MFU2_9ACTN|nr:DUF6285 domain-containing protein [Dactylosporangium vinaceum]UAB98869.1 hypothetical protein Dvina_12780 [Dactylosporangium vinaceum]
MTGRERPAHAAVPGPDDLLTAVVETLRDEILPQSGGRSRYLLKACVAALETVRRDLVAGPERAAVEAAVFAALEVQDEQALVSQIRAGLTPERFARVVAELDRRTDVELRVLGRG